jgi:hypothetical protein
MHSEKNRLNPYKANAVGNTDAMLLKKKIERCLKKNTA